MPSSLRQTLVDEISAIINGSEFWDEEICGLRAIGYAQVGHKSDERTLIDIQELAPYYWRLFDAYFVNGNFNDTSNLRQLRRGNIS